MNKTYPQGRALTVVWSFLKPDGSAFSLAGLLPSLKYRTGRGEYAPSGVVIDQSGALTFTIPASNVIPGLYSLDLTLYGASSIELRVAYADAFRVVNPSASPAPENETSESDVESSCSLVTVAEYFKFTPVVPTAGSDGYWYINGEKVKDGSGNPVHTQYTLSIEEDGTIIINEGWDDETEYDGLKDAIDGLSTLEEAVEAAEALRVSAETSRVTAESARASAEASRATAEGLRAAAETARVSAETARASAEVSRDSAESARVSAEGIRDGNETIRKSSETARVEAENNRATAEGTRVLAEAARASAETSRASAEQARATAESGRVASEDARGDAEAARVAAEGEREERALADHLQAVADSEQAASDHTRANTDHATAGADHTQAGTDHTRAGTDHSTASSDHTQAGNDHMQAGSDHTQAVSDHAQAMYDHESWQETLNQKANKDGRYDLMVVGAALNLDAPITTEDAFLVRPTGGADVEAADGVAQITEVKGNSVKFNQLVDTNTTTVTVTSGHKYYARISGTASVATSTGAAISVTGGSDTVIDLTAAEIADLTTVEAVEAWLAENIGAMAYYPHTAGTVLNNCMEGIEAPGYNLLDPTTGKAQIIGAYSDLYGNYYGIVGTHGTLTFTDAYGNESAITPDSDGKFELTVPGELSVASAGADCAVFLWWDGTKKEYQPYEFNEGFLDVKHIYGKLNGAGDLVQVWADGMPGDEDARDILHIEDGETVADKIYEQDTPLRYTNLVYQGSSHFADGTPVVLPVTYKVNNWSIESIIPQNTSSALVTASPVLTCKYSLGAVDLLNTHTDEIADLYATKADTEGSYPGIISGNLVDVNGVGTDQEFVYRPTGGGEALAGNGNGVVQAIKGRTLVWNQLAEPINRTLRGITATTDAATGIITFSGAGDGNAGSIQFFLNLGFKSGHKYYIELYDLDNSGITAAQGTSDKQVPWLFTSNMSLGNPGSPVQTSGIYTATADVAAGAAIRFTFSQNITQFSYRYRIQVIDLTAMFGAGYEPTTVAEFKALFPESYYAFTPSKVLLPLRISGLVSKDADDQELATLSLPVVGKTATDGNGNAIVPFPDGMYGTPTVYDTATKVGGSKVMGIVNLGELNWTKQTTGSGTGGGETPFFRTTISDMKRSTMQVVCQSYIYANSGDKRMNTAEWSSARQLNIWDSAFYNSTAAEFKAAMAGVYLVYERETPVPFTWDEPLEMIYPAPAGGTEAIIPLGVDESGVPATAPLKATIFYSKDYVQTINDMPKDFDTTASIDALASALATTLSTALNGTLTITRGAYDESTKKYAWTVTFTPNV